ncbi:MAG: hypothetical protein C4341_04445 [Armatimonadota bacterium]
MNDQAGTMLTCFIVWAVSLLAFVLFLILRSTFTWDAVIVGIIATGAPACLLAIGFTVVRTQGRPASATEAAALSFVSALLIVAAANLVFAFAPELSADPVTRGATALTSWQVPLVIGGALFLVLLFTRRQRADSEVD